MYETYLERCLVGQPPDPFCDRQKWSRGSYDADHAADETGGTFLVWNFLRWGVRAATDGGLGSHGLFRTALAHSKTQRSGVGVRPLSEKYMVLIPILEAPIGRCWVGRGRHGYRTDYP